MRRDAEYIGIWSKVASFQVKNLLIPLPAALFVFSIDDPKQNAGSLLTPVSSIVFDALSHGTLGFAFHGM